MPLRIRCPKCGTVQRIPIGVRPTCQKCGFAGNSADAQRASETPAEGQEEQVQWTAQPPPSAQSGQVAWGAAAPEGQVAWDAAPGAGAGAGPGGAAAPATGGAGGESAEGWADAQWPQDDAPAPKKKGIFRK
jgi:hypothetical protein